MWLVDWICFRIMKLILEGFHYCPKRSCGVQAGWSRGKRAAVFEGRTSTNVPRRTTFGCSVQSNIFNLSICTDTGAPGQGRTETNGIQIDSPKLCMLSYPPTTTTQPPIIRQLPQCFGNHVRRGTEIPWPCSFSLSTILSLFQMRRVTRQVKVRIVLATFYGQRPKHIWDGITLQ